MVERGRRIQLVRELVTLRHVPLIPLVGVRDHPHVPLLVNVHPVGQVLLHVTNTSMETVKLSHERVNIRIGCWSGSHVDDVEEEEQLEPRHHHPHSALVPRTTPYPPDALSC